MALWQRLARVFAQLLAAPAARQGDPGVLVRAAEPPTVILVFGVNGVGKTTTIAKLARRLLGEGRSVLLAAADTFRAGAVEQLKVWADRLGVPCVGGRGSGGGDPAAVAFDAIAAARARGIDTVLVDTAGRLSVVALRRELHVPIRFLGTGEGLADLQVFDAAQYARRLVSA